MIYFDNASTTMISRRVKDEIIDKIDIFGNPSSLHGLGLISKELINKSRNNIADVLNCSPEHIYFTSGASESNTSAINNFDKCVCGTTEHHSILNNPKVDTNIKNFTNEHLISKMLVNNETGEIYDIKSMRKDYKNNIFHTDATQAIGNVDIDINKLGVNMLSFSGHKIHAPKGIGVLYSNIPMKPLIYGGKQESGVRGGTENVIYINALSVALEESVSNINKKNIVCKEIKNNIVNKLYQSNIDFLINGSNTINSTLNISLKDIDGESLMNYLDIFDIYISTGSACNSGSLKLSETIESLNLPNEYKYGTIRLSFNEYNTLEESDIVVDKIVEYYKRINKVS